MTYLRHKMKKRQVRDEAITAGLITAVRRDYDTGLYTVGKLARMYRLDKSTIELILGVQGQPHGA